MRAVLSLLIAAGFLLVASGLAREVTGDVPALVRLFLLIAGGSLFAGGIYHGYLRIKRRDAYRHGRPVTGTIRLGEKLDSDDTTATLVFESAGGSWLIVADAGGVSILEDDAQRLLDATAYLGDDNRIYALDYGRRKLMPLSPGKTVNADTIRQLEARLDDALRAQA